MIRISVTRQNYLTVALSAIGEGSRCPVHAAHSPDLEAALQRIARLEGENIPLVAKNSKFLQAVCSLRLQFPLPAVKLLVIEPATEAGELGSNQGYDRKVAEGAKGLCMINEKSSGLCTACRLGFEIARSRLTQTHLLFVKK